MRPARVAAALATLALLLVVCSFTGQLIKYERGTERSFGIISQLNVDAERNAATWVAASLLLVSAILLLFIAWVRNAASRREALQWAGLGVIFLLLSLDESAALHELLIDRLRNRWQTDGFLYYPWVIFGAPFAVLVFIVYIPFLRRLPPRSRWFILLAGTVFCTGSLAMEMIGARYASEHGQANLVFVAIAHLEESLEFAGVILFIYALLDFLAVHAAPLTVVASEQRKLSSPPVSTIAGEVPEIEVSVNPAVTRRKSHLPSTSA